MPFTLKTSLSEFDLQIDARIEAAENAIVNTLMYVGEACITEARDNGSYIDQTGNLRSSIGYVVVKNGKIVKQKVGEQVKDGTDGNRQAQSYLNRLAEKHQTGICLIVVAGMSYAVYVEGRGKNVLTSAELLAERMVPQLLEQIGFIVKRK